MVDTPNLGLQRPPNGSFVNTWDGPLNGNFGLIDNAFGANSPVALSNIPVSLSSGQYGSAFITFSGTLTADVKVSFPSGVSRLWYISNDCLGTGSFSVIVQVSSNNLYVALPPNETIGVISNGTDMKFVGLDRIGIYKDFAVTSIPLWISASNPPPYLNCDGTVFSSATYPALRDYLGTTTLPDARGRFRATLNQATGRLTGTSSGNGLDGNTLLASGGNQTFGQSNLPNYNLAVTDPQHAHTFGGAQLLTFNGASFTLALGSDVSVGLLSNTANAATGISVNSSGTGLSYAPPSYTGGLTLIRAG